MKKENINHKIEIPDTVLNKWQNMVDAMAVLINVPAGLIMRISESDIEVFVSSQSEKNPYKKGEKEHLLGSGLYCEEVIRSKKELLIPNALTDNQWKNNPDIKLNMISYLGFPLLYPDKDSFGTICVLDSKENAYSTTYENLIVSLKEVIEGHLELLYINHILGEKNRNLSDYISEIQTLRGIIPICSSCKKIRDDKGYWNQIESYIQRHSEAQFSHSLCPDCSKKLYPDVNIYD